MQGKTQAATRMKMKKDYYALLGVKKDASYEDIKKAWREKARQWHPDKFLSEDEKLTAHRRFVEILEAYSVLIDARRRAVYDAPFSSAGVAGAYAGYENATPDQDQQEAADWFQRVLNESPSEFVRTTILVLIMCPVTLIVWLGVIGICVALYHVFTGQSSLGLGGAAMLVFLLLSNLLVSILGAFLLKDMYYRMKRILMWMAMRARIKRLFASLFKGRKPGRSLRI
jgi:DnaJ domain